MFIELSVKGFKGSSEIRSPNEVDPTQRNSEFGRASKFGVRNSMVQGVHKQKTRNPKCEVRIKWTPLGGVRSSGERRDSEFRVQNLMIRGERKSQSANNEFEERTRVFGECVFGKGLFGEMLVRKACSEKASSKVEEFGSVECSEFRFLRFKGIHVMRNAKCKMRVQNSEFGELR